MSASPLARGAREAQPGTEAEPSLRWPSLARAGVCCLPLLAIYEGSVLATDGVYRNSAESALCFALRFAGEWEAPLRWSLYALLAGLCLFWLHRRGEALLPALVRAGLEGLAAALLLGPALIASLGLLPEAAREFSLPADLPRELPSLARVGLFAGGALFEELLFRVLLYGLLFLIARRAALFFGLPAALARWSAEAWAALGQALLFAAFHLSGLLSWLGAGGESFDAGLFGWRVLAGVLLAAVCRWRGLAVAAYGHAGFNLALALGAGPGVFL